MTAHPAALPEDPLHRALARAAHLLPDQGPIGVFIHHNTLHAYQHLPFHEAVVAGAGAIGARPYLEAAAYREAWRSGRIEDEDIDAVLTGADDPLPLGLTERAVRRALLAEDLDAEDAAGLAHRARRDALWDAVGSRWAAVGWPRAAHAAEAPRRHRDVLAALGAEDPDVELHAELQRLAAGFLDQGQALAEWPGRDQGFLAAVAAAYAAGAGAPRWAPGVAQDFRRIAADHRPADVVAREGLAALGVGDDELDAFVEATLLSLPGWAGMFSRLERHPADNHAGAPTRLVDFLAVRVVLERRAVQRAAERAGLPLDWAALRARAPAPSPLDPICTVNLLHGLARAGAVAPQQVAELDRAAIERLLAAVDGFPPLARRRVFQEAYERRYRRQILDALAAHRPRRARPGPERPRAQFVFCIDEREESIRRALEELARDYQTFGAAGFFGVAIDYRGLDDAHPAPHSPVVVVPAHEVHETPVYTERVAHQQRNRLRSVWNRIQRALHASSRTPVAGAAQSVLVGPLSGIAVGTHVLAPRQTLALGRRVSASLAPRPLTRLQSRRATPDLRSDRGKYLGFTLQETVDRVATTLVNLGLTERIAPIVVVLGHGSTSLNNPHESAHDCGACGGRRGGANARLFAEMANMPEVRAALRSRGIVVPDDTWFVGALHDTSDDSVTYYDLEDLPPERVEQFDAVRADLDRARRQNALERARRFHDAPLSLTPEAALRHVEARAAHLAQPRPEYGHCTNAIAVVGRRELTRGLFLDRRPFLVTYDPAVDRDDAVLERILAAVGPVGAGINLEYYFSAVDNERFGCGTKLPHNVTGLLGVMNGSSSDLRTGLPRQMVELHEPMRLLLVVEASPESLLAVAGRQAEVRELVVNEWVQLVSVHPETGAMSVFSGGSFAPYAPAPVRLPVARTSPEWFSRSRDHLPPAQIEAALG